VALLAVIVLAALRALAHRVIGGDQGKIENESRSDEGGRGEKR
jgi:hypothetical protein